MVNIYNKELIYYLSDLLSKVWGLLAEYHIKQLNHILSSKNLQGTFLVCRYRSESRTNI